MASTGMRPSAVLLREEINGLVEQSWTEGTYWATADVAACYARYRSRLDGERGGGPALVAVRLSDLEASGDLRVDEQSADVSVPTASRSTEEEMSEAFCASGGGWRDSLAIFGSVVFLGRVKPRCVVVLEGVVSPEDPLVRDDAVSAPAPRQGVKP